MVSAVCSDGSVVFRFGVVDDVVHSVNLGFPTQIEEICTEEEISSSARGESVEKRIEFSADDGTTLEVEVENLSSDGGAESESCRPVVDRIEFSADHQTKIEVEVEDLSSEGGAESKDCGTVLDRIELSADDETEIEVVVQNLSSEGESKDCGIVEDRVEFSAYDETETEVEVENLLSEGESKDFGTVVDRIEFSADDETEVEEEVETLSSKGAAESESCGTVEENPDWMKVKVESAPGLETADLDGGREIGSLKETKEGRSEQEIVVFPDKELEIRSSDDDNGRTESTSDEVQVVQKLEVGDDEEDPEVQPEENVLVLENSLVEIESFTEASRDHQEMRTDHNNRDFSRSFADQEIKEDVESELESSDIGDASLNSEGENMLVIDVSTEREDVSKILVDEIIFHDDMKPSEDKNRHPVDLSSAKEDGKEICVHNQGDDIISHADMKLNDSEREQMFSESKVNELGDQINFHDDMNSCKNEIKDNGDMEKMFSKSVLESSELGAIAKENVQELPVDDHNDKVINQDDMNPSVDEIIHDFDMERIISKSVSDISDLPNVREDIVDELSVDDDGDKIITHDDINPFEDNINHDAQIEQLKNLELSHVDTFSHKVKEIDGDLIALQNKYVYSSNLNHLQCSSSSYESAAFIFSSYIR